MDVRVLNKFHDKADYNTVYLVGETLTIDDARAAYLIELGLVEQIEVVEAVEESVEEVAAPAKKATKRRSSKGN